jgi:hypothetical protein
VPHEPAARRPGDPPVLIGDASRARAHLGWQPARNSRCRSKTPGNGCRRGNRPEPRSGPDQPSSPDKPSEFACFEDRISLLSIIKFPVSGKKGIKLQVLETIAPFCPVRMMKTVTTRQAKYEFRPRGFPVQATPGPFFRNEANPGFMLPISDTRCRIVTANCAK